MITRVKASSIDALDNVGYVSLMDIGNPADGDDFGPLIVAQLALGYAVYIPAGEYICSPMIWPAGSTVFGSGPKSVLKLKDSSNQVLISAGSGTDARNFRINGNKANQIVAGCHGIQVSNALETSISSVSTFNCKGDGFNITGSASDGVYLNNCSSSGFTGNGIKVESGNNIVLNSPKTINSDLASTGDGIAITSVGVAITGVTINNPISTHNVGRGLVILGSGSRNIKNVSIVNPLIYANAVHGILVINAENCSISNGTVYNNTMEGVRIEGDVQFCRINNVLITGNTVFGLREIISGAAPNNNGLIYNLVRGNGNDVITKVGAQSFIV